MQTARWRQTSTARTASSSECEEEGFYLCVCLSAKRDGMACVLSCRQVGKDLKDIPADAKVIDAAGQYVIPGEHTLC